MLREFKIVFVNHLLPGTKTPREVQKYTEVHEKLFKNVFQIVPLKIYVLGSLSSCINERPFTFFFRDDSEVVLKRLRLKGEQ